MKKHLKLFGSAAGLVACLIGIGTLGSYLSSPQTAHAAAFTIPTQNLDVTVITITNKVPDNVTETTQVGQAINIPDSGKLAFQWDFAYHAAGTEVSSLNLVTTADGTNYATSAQFTISMAGNGTTKVRTNVVLDLGPRKKVKVFSIVCGNTTTADMTNSVLTVTK